MPLALFFLSQEQSERDFLEGSQDARGAVGVTGPPPAFSLTEGLVRVHLPRSPWHWPEGGEGCSGSPMLLLSH